MKTRFDSAEVWRTNSDTKVSIKELETSHLMNIVRMLLRRPETVLIGSVLAELGYEENGNE